MAYRLLRNPEFLGLNLNFNTSACVQEFSTTTVQTDCGGYELTEAI